MRSEAGWQRNGQDAANVSDGSTLQRVMARNRSLRQVAGIDPDIVPATVMVQETSLGSQVPFEGAAVHAESLLVESSQG